MRGPIGAPGIEPGIWLRPRLPIVVGGAFRCVQWPVRAQKRPANGRNNRRAWSAPQRTLRPPMAPLRPHPSCPLERPLGIPLERPLDIPRISLNVATCGAHFDMAYPHGGRAISPPALSFSVLSLFHFLSFSAIFFFFLSRNSQKGMASRLKTICGKTATAERTPLPCVFQTNPGDM